MNSRTVIIVVAIIAVLVVIGILVMKNKNTSSSTTTNTTSTQPSTSPTTSPTPAPSSTPASSAIISYTTNGFTPSSVTVKSGGTVTIKNDSNMQLQFNSNPHPTHTDNSELNVGTIAPGSSKTITVTKAGTWGYHNHLNPSDGGTIIVQ